MLALVAEDAGHALVGQRTVCSVSSRPTPVSPTAQTPSGARSTAQDANQAAIDDLCAVLERRLPSELEHRWAAVYIAGTLHSSGRCPIAWGEDLVVLPVGAQIERLTMVELLAVRSSCVFCMGPLRSLHEFRDYYRSLILWDCALESGDPRLLASVVLAIDFRDPAFDRWSRDVHDQALRAGRDAFPRPLLPPAQVWVTSRVRWPAAVSVDPVAPLGKHEATALLWGERVHEGGSLVVCVDQMPGRHAGVPGYLGATPASWEVFAAQADVASSLARDQRSVVSPDLWETAGLLVR